MKLILFILILLPFFSFSQKVSQNEVDELYKALPKVGDNYELSEVVQLDTSFSKKLLYKNAKLFFVNTFKSAKDVIQYDERDEGKIIGKGSLYIEDSHTSLIGLTIIKMRVNFSLEIICKDGRYRYRLYGINIDFSRTTGSGIDRRTFNSVLSIDGEYKNTIEGIDKKLNRKLLFSTITQLNLTVNDLKFAMLEKQSSDNF